MAEAEKSKNWFAKHKFLTVVIVVVALIVVGGALSDDDGSDSSRSGTANTNEEIEYRFDDRADKQDTDVEVLPGETATIRDVSMTVNEVNYTTSIGEFQTADSGETYVIANVTIENGSDSTESYNVFDFRIQTAGGQVLDGAFASVDNSLSSGDLVSGGTVTGNIVFEVPVEEGSQFIIWKPSAFNSDRAIVKVQ